MFSALPGDIQWYLASYVAEAICHDLDRMLVLRTTSKCMKYAIDKKIIRYLFHTEAKCVRPFTKTIQGAPIQLNTAEVYKCSVSELKSHVEYMQSDEYELFRNSAIKHNATTLKRKASQHRCELKKFEKMKRQRKSTRHCEGDEDWNDWSMKEINEQIQIHTQNMEYYTHHMSGYDNNKRRYALFKDRFFNGHPMFKWIA